MPKFNPKKWKEKEQDKELQLKYGDNWRVIKRTIKERQEREQRRKNGTIR